jgi:hypothetical protein
MSKVGRPRKQVRFVDLFLRVPPEARQALEIEADRRGVKAVEIGREVVIAWAAKQQKTSTA